VRRIWLLSLLFSLGLSLPVWAAGPLGEWLRPIPAVVLDLNACESPCWHGIFPGLDHWDKADAALLADGYLPQGDYGYRLYALSVFLKPGEAPDCTISLELVPYDGDILISTIFLNECHGFTLGDLLAVLGPPREILPLGLSSGTVTLAGASLSFSDGRIIVHRRGDLRPGHPWFSPDTQISQIEIHRASAIAFLPPATCRYLWQGFRPQSHYRTASSGLC
jgi:hypothetical protein